MATSTPVRAGMTHCRVSSCSWAAATSARASLVRLLGLVPFFGYMLVVFLVPIGFILFEAFRRTTTTGSTRTSSHAQE